MVIELGPIGIRRREETGRSAGSRSRLPPARRTSSWRWLTRTAAAICGRCCSTGDALAAERRRAATLPRLTVSSREKGDIVMLGIGGFTPLEGFMTHADWQGVCDGMKTASGLFWPIPITLSADAGVRRLDPHRAATSRSSTPTTGSRWRRCW